MIEKIVKDFAADTQQDGDTLVITVSTEDADDAFDIKCDLCEALELSGYTITDEGFDHDSVQVVIASHCSAEAIMEMEKEIIGFLENNGECSYREIAEVFGNDVDLKLNAMTNEKQIACIHVAGRELYATSFRGKKGMCIL